MKIVFLDIDGVLNVYPQGYDDFGAIFHQHFMDNLKRIIDETGAKIVISSSWRHDGLERMQEMWKHRKLSGEVIDVTPGLHLMKGGCIQFYNGKLKRHPTERVHGYSVPRGCEIDYWLRNEAQRFGVVENFCVIDDDVDFLLQHQKHFVKCSGNTDHPDAIDLGLGLTDKCTDKAIEILNTVKLTYDNY